MTLGELKIIHTTDRESLLIVAVPTLDGHTSDIVLPFKTESYHVFHAHERSLFVHVFGVLVSFSATLGFINAYIVVVLLLFTELQAVFCILLMSYNATGLVAMGYSINLVHACI